MTTILIRNRNAHGIYHSMAEGMAEVKDDDREIRAAQRLSRLIEATDANDVVYPAIFTLPMDLSMIARDVLENCLDNRENWQVHDDEENENPNRGYILAGEIIISIGGLAVTDPAREGVRPIAVEMNTAEALEIAQQVLEEAAAETDTASPEGHRLRLALEVITEILAQEGCEVFGVGGPDGKLTTLCDVAVFG